MFDMFDAFSKLIQFIVDGFQSVIQLFKLAFDAYGYLVATIALLPLYVQTTILTFVGIALLMLLLSFVKGVV